MTLGLGQRTIAPEWLDDLPSHDEGARSSRRDLQRLNWWMRHVTIFRRELSRRPSRRIVELGAGDGTFLLQLARQIPPAHFTLVDRNPSVSVGVMEEFRKLRRHVEVVQEDVFDWMPRQPLAETILCNLFLHHFEPGALRRLLAMASSRCETLIACEPHRGGAALLMSRMLWLIGCHPVTLHDAVVSVRAGFRGCELSAAWPAANWTLREERAGLFTHLFVASRR